MITIRPAQPQDADGMAHMMVDAYLAAHHGHVPEEAWQRRKAEWTYDVSARAWRRSLVEIVDGVATQNCIFLAVDEDSDNIVGLAMGVPSEEEALTNAGEIVALYISRGHQRHGLGRQLVHAVAAHMAGKGKTALLIGVLAANISGRHFYEALGGQIVGARQSDDYGFRLDEVLYGWSAIYAIANTST